MLQRPSGTIAILSDFGAGDPRAGLLRAAALRPHPRGSLLDLGELAPPGPLACSGFWLRAAAPRLPAGTVVAAAIGCQLADTTRLLAVSAAGCYWVAPDNGLLSGLLAAHPTAELRALDLNHLGLPQGPCVDVAIDQLGPAAGLLASGRYGYAAVGPRCDDARRLPAAASPVVLWIDQRGSVLLDLPAAGLPAGTWIGIGNTELRWPAGPAGSEPGQLRLVVSSLGLLAVEQSGGHAASTLAVAVGQPITVGTAEVRSR